MVTSGYDDPIGEESADLLGRAGFARELAALAVASPYGWSTRIGVYGRWGEGKTSVVRLAQRYLEDEGHLTVDFNPWGCRDAQEMIAVLADAILNVAKKAKLAVPGRIKRGLKWIGGLVGAGSKKAQNLALPGPAPIALAVNVAARLSPWLERWARDRKEDIGKALAVIDLGRRLIVFVDDVDRLDPKLLPTLMFALHEVFAIPGVTFIVALDPAVVGAALNEYHRGFGDGLEFLEKIIQFPRWLPPVAEEDLQRVAEADRRLHAPFISAGVLADNRDILPRNPRELRMLIRGLMPLSRAFERHDPDELDQHLLVLLACFRQRFPQTLVRMLDDEQLLDQCGSSAFDEKFAEAFAKQVKTLVILSKELAVDERGDRVARFDQLVEAFSDGSISWNAKHIRYHANLTDRPDALTWKEFRALIATPTTSGKALDVWIAMHAAHVKAPVSAVAAELLDSLVRYHNTTMDESATAATAEAHADRIRRVATAVGMLRLLWFSSAHGSGLRTARNFRAVVGTFRSWARFDLNSNDRAQRAAEATLLEEMITVIENATECLAILEPWNYDEPEDQAVALTERITRALVARAAPAAMDRFAEAGGIKTMFRSKHLATEYVLTQSSPTWLEDGRRMLRDYVKASPQVVAENVRLFVESLLKPMHFSAEARTLLADRSLVELWWGLIIAVRWQARFFRGLEKMKGQLEAGNPLSLPPWWEDARHVAYRDSPAANHAGNSDPSELDDMDKAEAD